MAKSSPSLLFSLWVATAPLLLLLLLVVSPSRACTLCNLRLPPRPRPLDQFQLPPIPPLPDQVPSFCNASASLPVSTSCHLALEHLLCTADRFVAGITNQCPGAESPDECSECSRAKDSAFWIVSWFDALGKPPAGVSDGNFYWLGDYMTCSTLKSAGQFDGKYCRVDVSVPDALVEAGCPQTDPLQIILGACLPENCTESELATVVREYLPYDLSVACEHAEGFSLGAIAFMVAVAIWCALVVLSTVIEKASLSPHRWMVAFSLRMNGHDALSTKRPHTMHALQGLEVLSLLAYIVGSTYAHMLPYVENAAFSFDSIWDWRTHPLFHYTYHIDGLFALNALFTAHRLADKIDSIGAVGLAVKERFIRLWPLYAFVVIFMAVVFPQMTTGPMWIHSDIVARCQDGWLVNLLMLNDFFPATKTCVDLGYAASQEFQFFVLLVLGLWLARKRPTLATVIGVLLALFSTIYTFVVVYWDDLPPAPMLTVQPISESKMEALLSRVVVVPWTRITPYVLGYLFSRHLFTSHYRIAGPATLGIASALALFAGVVSFSLFPWSSAAAMHPIWLAIYASVHRPVWALVLLSIVLLCYNGKFKVLSGFLSWRIFSPLSKLVIPALLLSEPVILYLFSALHRPFHATHWSTLYAALGATALALFVAFLVDIVLMRPIRHLLLGTKSAHSRRCDSVPVEYPQR